MVWQFACGRRSLCASGNKSEKDLGAWMAVFSVFRGVFAIFSETSGSVPYSILLGV